MFSLLDNFTVCGLTAFRLSLYVSYILLWKCYPYREKYAAMFTILYTQEFQRDHKNQIKILLNMQEYELTEDQSYIFHYHNYFGTVIN